MGRLLPLLLAATGPLSTVLAQEQQPQAQRLRAPTFESTAGLTPAEEAAATKKAAGPATVPEVAVLPLPKQETPDCEYSWMRQIGRSGVRMARRRGAMPEHLAHVHSYSFYNQTNKHRPPALLPVLPAARGVHIPRIRRPRGRKAGGRRVDESVYFILYESFEDARSKTKS